MTKGLERRWRFVHDQESAPNERHWRWNVCEQARVRIASLGRFATLEDCIADARRSGFSFAQPYDIVFARVEPAREAV